MNRRYSALLYGLPRRSEAYHGDAADACGAQASITAYRARSGFPLIRRATTDVYHLQSLLLLCWLLPFLFVPLQSRAEERILAFDSTIIVEPESSLLVTETITVMVKGEQVKRGFFYDFPTRYQTGFLNEMEVGFNVLSITRNGQTEPYVVEPYDKGMRISIGHEHRKLPLGEHTYVLTYRTTNQIRYLAHHDQLYWNVTGNGWVLPIDKASARIMLPKHAEFLDFIAYTGKRGERGLDYEVRRDDDQGMQFETSRRLTPGEGLTIAVSWPKGIVQEPDFATRFQLQYGPLLIPGILWIILFGYYAFSRYSIRRDHKRSVIIPLFAPPEHLSPALLRYLRDEKQIDLEKAATASLLSLGAKQFLRIEEVESGVYYLHKTGEMPLTQLFPTEQALLQELFRPADSIRLDTQNHQTLQAAMLAFEKRLLEEYAALYRRKNRRYLLTGSVISLLALAANVLTSGNLVAAAFLSVLLTLLGGVSVRLSRSMWRGWRALCGEAAAAQPATIARAVLGVGCIGIEVGGLTAFVSLCSGTAAGIFLLFLLTNGVFFHWLKALKLHGPSMMHRIEGFAMYLALADKEQLRVLHPPRMTVERFESYLPYALALDVGELWAEQFTNTMPKGVAEKHQPAWYLGHRQHLNPSGFIESLSSRLASAIRSVGYHKERI